MSFILPVEIKIPSKLQKLMEGPRPATFTVEQIQDILNFLEEYDCHDDVEILDMPSYRGVFAYRGSQSNLRAMFMNMDFTTNWAQLSKTDRYATFGPADILARLKDSGMG